MATRVGSVLLVEHDEMFGRLVRRIIEPDHELSVVESIVEAMNLIYAGSRYDLILCDLQTPSELEAFLGWLRSAAPEQVGCVVAIAFDAADVPRGTEMIVRTFTPNALRGLVERYVSRERQ